MNASINSTVWRELAQRQKYQMLFNGAKRELPMYNFRVPSDILWLKILLLQ